MEKAGSVTIDCLSIGLGYTAVMTSDGGMGLSGTYFAGEKPGSLNKDYMDPEGLPAGVLLKNILQPDMVKRSMAQNGIFNKLLLKNTINITQ